MDKDRHAQLFTKLMYDWGIHDFGILIQTYEIIDKNRINNINRARNIILSILGACMSVSFGIEQLYPSIWPESLTLIFLEQLDLPVFLHLVVTIVILGIVTFASFELILWLASKRHAFIDNQIKSAVDRLEYCRDGTLLRMPPYNDCQDGDARNHQVGANLITAASFYGVFEKIQKHDKHDRKHDEFRRVKAIASENSKTCKNILTWHAAFKPTDEYPQDVIEMAESVVKDLKTDGRQIDHPAHFQCQSGLNE